MAVSRFPCLIGRSGECHVRLESPGVWERHAELSFARGEGFVLTILLGALGLVNGERITKTLLRNGDKIELGSARLQFRLSEARRSDLKVREALTWASLVAVAAAEGFLIFRLLQM